MFKLSGVGRDHWPHWLPMSGSDSLATLTLTTADGAAGLFTHTANNL